MVRKRAENQTVADAETAEWLAAAAPDLRDDLLAWYDRHRRVLPWRAPAGGRADPYRVWLSEVMLQQTTVATVGGYFQDFVTRWPTVTDLAAAEDEAVMTAWAGLGYYARARNLLKCARAVARDHGGRFPETEAELATLPGIGAYTAAAIAAIAFDEPAAVMDGNVERVVARLAAVETPLPDAKPELRALTGILAPPDRAGRPGDFAQATMDLGATVCTPRKPKCILCPWQPVCRGRLAGLAEGLPAKRPKAPKPTRRAVAFVLIDRMGNVLLRRRPESGLLGGMMEVPSSDWTEQAMPAVGDVVRACPIATRLTALPGLVRHTFTHFHLEVTVATGRTETMRPPPECRWVALTGLKDQALPTVMRKILDHAAKHRG